MADEQTGALAASADGSATASGTTETPTTDAANQQQETPEQRVARLEAALREAEDKANRERELRLSHQSKVEEANRALQQPPTNGASDPIYARAQELHQKLERANAFMQANPGDFAAEMARDRVLEQIHQLKNSVEQQRINQWVDQQNAKINASSEPDAIKQRAFQLVQSGVEAETAIAAAIGERARKSESERVAADAAAAASLRSKPNTAAGGGAASRTENVVTLSEYTRRVDAGDSKLMADVDARRVQLDYTR